jgi:hypothetical protein
MDEPQATSPGKHAVQRALASSDADAIVMLLAFLVVAVCGACELVLFLPHALGALGNAPHTDAVSRAVTQTPQEAREMAAVAAISRPAASGR